MNDDRPVSAGYERLAEMSDLSECLRKIGKAMVASGTSVGVVENTLTEIALAHGATCEIVALPNLLIIQLWQSPRLGRIEVAVQRLTTLQLNQLSELGILIDRVRRREIPLPDASAQIDRILALAHRFPPAVVVLAYFVSSAGLTMLFRPEPAAVLVAGAAGVVVGLLVHWFRRWPRFHLLLPVVSAIVVSALIFNLTRLGVVVGSTNLIIPPLVTFLPGVLLTNGMIELASMHILSGSSRLIYGSTVLLFLFFGIAIGLQFSGLAATQVYAYQDIDFSWWTPPLGTLLFGIGIFVQLSGENRDLLWMLLVLYIAMVGQYLGEAFLNPYFGVFIAATLMALSSELIARSSRRTSALVSQALAFWFLVPGARGLLSVTSILSRDLESAAIGLTEVVVLLVSIAMGVLLGTLLISPQKFVPVNADAGWRPEDHR